MDQDLFDAGELRRIAALTELGVLDTEPEAVFDQTLEVATALLGMPMAAISLVDGRRQWLKARRGIAPGPDTPREFSLCSRAIQHPQEVMVVEDARRDERFAHFPSVLAEPGLRFYAGAPLVLSSGEALGALCVLDVEPRTLDEGQQRALQVLAGQTVALFEARRDQRRLLRSLLSHTEKQIVSLTG